MRVKIMNGLTAAVISACSAAVAEPSDGRYDVAYLDREAIVVTGGRKSLLAKGASLGVLGDRSVMETPFAIDGYNRALIDEAQAVTISDVLKNDPSVTITRTRGTFSDTPNVRGFPIGSSGVLYDGMLGILQGGAIYQLEAIERVDLLAGPASFFYGASAFGGVGGAVNYVPKRAPSGAAVRDVEVQFSEPSYVAARVDLGRRFAQDRIGARFNGAIGEGELVVEKTDTERRVADLALDWRAKSGDLRVFADFAYVQNHMGGYQNSFAIAAGVPVPDAPDGRDNLSIEWADYPTELGMAVLKGEWDFWEDWTLTLAAATSVLERPTIPSPGSPTIINSAGDFRLSPSYTSMGEYDNRAYNAAVNGAVKTGVLTHELVFAADYQQFDYTASTTTTLGPFISNLYNPVQPAEPAFPADGPRRKTIESAGYGFAASDIITLGESGFSLLLGGRYSQFTYDQYSAVTGALTSAFDDGRFNPIVALMYKPSDATLIYANYSEAFERGGTAPTTAVNANEVQPALETKSYEIGAKAEWRGVTFQAAMFEIEKGLEYTNAANLYVQDGKQIHRGLEAQASGAPIEGLALTGGFMLLDPKVENTANPADEGNEPIGVPKFQATFYAQYDISAAPGLSVNAGVYHYDKQFIELSNRRSIPAWTRLDLGAAYAFEARGTPVVARVAVENVTDEAYWSGLNGGLLSVGAGRTAKLSLAASF